MNKEKKITDLLARELTDVIKSIKETGKEQLPLLAKDLLIEQKIIAYSNILSAILMSILGSAIIAAGFIGFNNIQDSAGHFVALIVGILLGGLIVLLSIVQIIEEVTDLFKLKYSPRAVLLARLKKLLK